MSTKAKGNDDATEEGAKGGKKKLMIIALVAVLALGAGAYFFLFSGSSAEAAAPQPGSVLVVDPVAVNLAGGSYLKVGLALQFTVKADAAAGKEGAHDGSKAQDLAIAHFSGAALTDVQNNREAMKAALQEQIAHAYHDEVMSIYYTQYVTQ